MYLIVTEYLLCAKHLGTPWLAKRTDSCPHFVKLIIQWSGEDMNQIIIKANVKFQL